GVPCCCGSAVALAEQRNTRDELIDEVNGPVVGSVVDDDYLIWRTDRLVEHRIERFTYERRSVVRRNEDSYGRAHADGLLHHAAHDVVALCAANPAVRAVASSSHRDAIHNAQKRCGRSCSPRTCAAYSRRHASRSTLDARGDP